MNIPTSKVMTAVASLLVVGIPFIGRAGIQGSGFRSLAVVAPVTASGAGTISVGGVSYSDPGATVEVDGHASSQAQVRVGDVVTAYGHAGNGDNPDVIERLILNHAVRATVESVDAASGTFSAAGQTIHVNSATALDPTLTLIGLSALLPGAKVRVSGWLDATGDIVASRIDLLALAAGTEVNGQLYSLDSARHRFKINRLTVDFSAAEVEGTLQEGAAVIVGGSGFDRTGALLARQVQVVPPLQVAAGQIGRLDGIVTSLTSATHFEVNGQPVQVTSATKLTLHGAVTLNAHVRVDGAFDSSGVLIASKLQTRKN
jgi:hypothetical protein